MENKFQYNPLVNKYPFGACSKNTIICYTLKISSTINVSKVLFAFNNVDNKDWQEKEMNKSLQEELYNTYEVNIDFSLPNIYSYVFKIVTSNETYYIQKDFNNPVINMKNENIINPYIQIVYECENDIVSKIKKGIIYQIFVDRFNRSGDIMISKNQIKRDDWGGDLEQNSNSRVEMNKEVFGGNIIGIDNKLDYLTKLGVNIIYLSPIFESPSNHKYDTANYMNVDKGFGGDVALKQLIIDASQNNISIILDGVFAHTGSDSIYFNSYNNYESNGAYNSQDSPYIDWYRFKEWPDKYDSWWGVKTLPQTNQNSQSFINFITNSKDGVIAKYMKMGIGGFRLDVVDELTNEFTLKICETIRNKNEKALIIGEVWEDASTKVAYDQQKKYFLGNNVNSVMNYPLKGAIIDYVLNNSVDEFKKVSFTILDQYPYYIQHNLMNIIGTHDTERILSILLKHFDRETAIQKLKIATLLQYTFIGIPSIFYGDEVGIEGGEAPLCRQCYPWGSENKEIFAWYKKLGKLRKLDIFENGKMELLYVDDGVICFSRKYKLSNIIVVINQSCFNFEIELDGLYKSFFSSKEVNKKANILADTFDVLIKQ